MCSFDGVKEDEEKVRTTPEFEAFFRGFQYKNDLKTG